MKKIKEFITQILDSVLNCVIGLVLSFGMAIMVSMFGLVIAITCLFDTQGTKSNVLLNHFAEGFRMVP